MPAYAGMTAFVLAACVVMLKSNQRIHSILTQPNGTTMHFQRKIFFALGLLSAAISSWCTPPNNDGFPDSVGISQTLQHLASKHGICTVTAAVIRNRQVEQLATAQGCPADSPLTPDAVFEAASLSKPVFAYAVLKLVQAGKMNLDAPVVNYLPRGYEHKFHPWLVDSKSEMASDPRLGAVTVRMALNHTAGLPNWSAGPLLFDAAPGTQWQYSGEGYALLQSAVENVTGEKLDQFMTRTVFKPLGMRHSAYTREPRLEPFLIPGTNRDGVPLKPWPFLSPVSAFTLYTSAQDYGLFLAALLQDQQTLGQIVDVPAPVNSKLDLRWGLGWGLEGRDDGLFIWHWGNNPGYRNFVMASPRTGNGFVMLSGSDNGLMMAEALGQSIFEGPHPVFRFPLLRDGLAGWLCETLDVCP